jgi:hypothetical protein
VKNATTCDFDGDGRVLASGPLLRLKKILGKEAFADQIFTEGACRELRSAKALPSLRGFAEGLPAPVVFNEFHGIKTKLTWRSIHGKLMKILLDEIKFIKMKLVYTIFNT